MSVALLAAAAEDREASPIALVIVLLLLAALVLLIRSMNRHLRKVPPSFDERAGPGTGDGPGGPSLGGTSFDGPSGRPTSDPPRD
jgi:hypothetical protein